MSKIWKILVMSTGSRNCGQMQRTMPTVHTCPFIFFCGRKYPDYSNMDALLATKQEHEEITAKIEAFLKQDAWRCYTLSTDSCSICEKCTYPKKSCNHPDLMHPCIESHGILLTKNIEEKSHGLLYGRTDGSLVLTDFPPGSIKIGEFS
jgi:hypothetical protein